MSLLLIGSQMPPILKRDRSRRACSPWDATSLVSEPRRATRGKMTIALLGRLCYRGNVFIIELENNAVKTYVDRVYRLKR